MRRRTAEDQEREFAYIQTQSLLLVKIFTFAELGTPAYRKARHAAGKMLNILANRERDDRCYYCHSTKKELGTESATGLTQCIDCTTRAYGERLEVLRRLQNRLNEYGIP